MKNSQLVRIIIPITLLLGIATASVIVILGGQQANASTNDNKGTSTVPTESISFNLWVEGISGESTKPGRENSIDVYAFSHNIKIAVSDDIARKEITEHTPIRFVKEVDKATPKLMEACSKGEAITSVIFRCYEEPTGLNYFTISLSNAKILSVQNYGSMTSEQVPMEQITLNYATIKWTYTEYDSEGNQKGKVEWEDTWETPTPTPT